MVGRQRKYDGRTLQKFVKVTKLNMTESIYNPKVRK